MSYQATKIDYYVGAFGPTFFIQIPSEQELETLTKDVKKILDSNKSREIFLFEGLGYSEKIKLVLENSDETELENDVGSFKSWKLDLSGWEHVVSCLESLKNVGVGHFYFEGGDLSTERFKIKISFRESL